MIEAVRHMRQHMRHIGEAHCPMHRMRQESASASGIEPQTQSLDGAQALHVTSISVQVAEPAHMPLDAHAPTLPSEFHSHERDSSAQALSSHSHSHPAHHTSISLFPVALIADGVAVAPAPAPAWAASPSARIIPSARLNSFRSPLRLEHEHEHEDLPVPPHSHALSHPPLPLLSAILARRAGEPQLLHASRSRVQSSSVELEMPSAVETAIRLHDLRREEPLLMPSTQTPTSPALEATIPKTSASASASVSASSIHTPLALASTLATPAVTRQLHPDVRVASSALAAEDLEGDLHCMPVNSVNNGQSVPIASSRAKQSLDGFGALRLSPSASASTKPKSSRRHSSSRSRRARKFWASASSSSASDSNSDSHSADERAALQPREFTAQQSQSDEDVVFERENEPELSNSNASASRVPRGLARGQLDSSSAASASTSTSDDESGASDTDSLLDELGVRLGARESRPLLALTAGAKKPAQSMQQRLSQVLESFYAELNNVRGMRCN